MRLLLDTHAFLELAEQDADRFSVVARKALSDPGNQLLLSAVSITEIAIKSAIQKLDVSASDLLRAMEDLQLQAIEFTSLHAVRMFDLPLHHRDPFDRMLIATALCEDIPLVSRDTVFKSYLGLRQIK